MAKIVYSQLRMFLIVFLCCIHFHSFSQSLSWVQQIGNPSVPNSEAAVIQSLSDANNNTYFIGSFKGIVDFDNSPNVNALTSVGPFDMFLLKEDANGNFLWVKQFPCLANSPNSGLFPKNMTTDNNSNIYVTGAFEDSVDFDPSPSVYKMYSYGVFSSEINTFVLKLTTNGDFVWVKQMGGVTLNTSWGQGLKIDQSGNIYLASNFSGNIDADPDSAVLTLSGSGILIHKLTNNGNLLWVKHIPGSGRVWSFTTDSLFNLIIDGQFNGTVDFDPSPNSMNLTSASAVSYDIYVEKFDSSGNYQWVKQIGSTGDDVAQGVATDKSGNVLVTGFFSGTADFNPSSAVNNLTASGTKDIFVLKLNNNGVYQWAYNFGGGSADHGVTISTDSLNNVITTGDFQAQADFNPGIGINNITSQGNYDVFVQKLDSSGNFIWVDEFGSTGYDMPVCFSIDGAGNYYVSGSIGEAGFGGSGDFDPGIGITILSGNNDGFIEKLCNSPQSLNIEVLNDTICVGDTAVLSVETLLGATYIWGKAGVPIANSNHDTLKVTQAGSYTVGVYGVGCPYWSDTIHLTVLPVITPTINIYSTQIHVAIGQQVTINANVFNTGGYSYSINWYNHGVLFATTTTPTVSFTKQIDRDSITAIITLNTPCTNPVTSNLAIVTGMNDVYNQPIFFIAPNPANSILYIQTQQTGSLEIADITGRIISKIQIPSTKFQMDVSSLAEGVYIYRFTSKDKETVQGKLVIVK